MFFKSSFEKQNSPHQTKDVEFKLNVMFPFTVDGCTNYTDLRQVSHSNRTCDRNDLITGWYRLQGAFGNRITDLGVWFKRPHPTVTRGAESRRVCFRGDRPCCLWGSLIKVKSCSSYYVYELQKNSTYHLCYLGNADVGNLTRCLRCISWQETMR